MDRIQYTHPACMSTSLWWFVLAAALVVPAGAAAAGTQVCSAESGAARHTLVELFTSEGCSSCPPADRWLSGLAERDDLVALAFHVDYWDRLGWTDRFATPRHTQRQHERAAQARSGYVYTPQVLVNGRDFRQWAAYPGGEGLASVDPASEFSQTNNAGVVPLLSDVFDHRLPVWSIYPQYEADGVTEKPKTLANRNAAFQQWANGFFASTKAQVRSYETQTSAAVQAAKDAIGEFDT